MNISDGVSYKNREEWLNNRCIGASDVAAICGENPYKSPYAFWAECVGLIPRSEETLSMRYGHAIEHFISSEFEKETGISIHDPGNYTVFADRECPELKCTPDRIIVESDGTILGVVELKAMDSIRFSRLDNEIPLSYQIQVQAQMACCDCEYGYLVMLVGAGKKLEILRVERHEKMINAIRKKVKEFARRIAEKDPPPVDSMESTENALRKIHAADNGETVDFSGNEKVAYAFELYAAVKQNKKLLDIQEAEAKNIVMDALKENTFGVSEFGKVSWKTQTRKGSVTVSREHIDLLLTHGIPYKVTEDSISRVLRITTAKGE